MNASAIMRLIATVCFVLAMFGVAPWRRPDDPAWARPLGRVYAGALMLTHTLKGGDIMKILVTMLILGVLVAGCATQGAPGIQTITLPSLQVAKGISDIKAANAVNAFLIRTECAAKTRAEAACAIFETEQAKLAVVETYFWDLLLAPAPAVAPPGGGMDAKAFMDLLMGLAKAAAK